MQIVPSTAKPNEIKPLGGITASPTFIQNFAMPNNHTAMPPLTRTHLSWLLAFLTLALASLSHAAGIEMEVFVRQGCPHCAKAEQFLRQLQTEQTDLQLSIRDVSQDSAALQRLTELTRQQGLGAVRVPAFYVHDKLLVGYADEHTTGQWLRNEIAAERQTAQPAIDSESCEVAATTLCEAPTAPSSSPVENFSVEFLGHQLTLDQVGLPAFTLAMGLLDGFNPCSMWVLILMISLLAPMGDRRRMLAVAGSFVAVEGLAYFLFMAAWLNLFLFVGLSRISEVVIAAIALIAGAINLKDFWAFGWGVSLSIPKSAKPGIYQRLRSILQANNVWAAMFGAIALALLVQIVELFCTSGFPALYTRILTLRAPDAFGYYAYLMLYNVAYMLDDIIVLSIGVITLSQHRLQENEGRWLKLISGLVMVALGLVILLKPQWLA